MFRSLHVHLLPSLIELDSLPGSTAVIIDILRASSTIMTALHNGASHVVPCGTPDEALLVKQRCAPGSVLLGGERGGVRITGFDLGNSPAEYPPEVVSGKTVAFTTTNGTKALLAASAANEILIGAFLNREALVERLGRIPKPIHLICAGTDGVITGEDVLFAGAIVDALQCAAGNSSNEPAWTLNDSATIALGFWKNVTSRSPGPPDVHPESEPELWSRARLSELVQAALKQSRGGQNLVGLGYESDITLCSQLDTIRLIPRYVRSEQCLTACE